MTLMSALAVTSENIGLVVTQSTTFAQPYAIARQFASLDVLSGGRAAWNVVTSTQETEAANHGQRSLAAHADRYDRAAEFVKVVKGFWETSKPGLVVGDKEAAQLFDPTKISVFKHDGKHLR
jgi:alkanesulfonate monooxygenase